MSYEKQTWVTGETITAEKLNHMEDGISAGAMVLHYDSEEGHFDKTFNEVRQAIENGILPTFLKEDGIVVFYNFINYDVDRFNVYGKPLSGSGYCDLEASSEDDYLRYAYSD